MPWFPMANNCFGLTKQLSIKWLRGPDLNRRPSGYEPDELPNCSTPRPIGDYYIVASHSFSSTATLLSKDFKMVPRAGLEPACLYRHYPLKIACLPISPPRQALLLNSFTEGCRCCFQQGHPSPELLAHWQVHSGLRTRYQRLRFEYSCYPALG